MPDANGWHNEAFYFNGLPYRWHFCQGADHDVLVADNTQARSDHFRACMARQRKEKADAERKLRAERKRQLALARAARRG